MDKKIALTKEEIATVLTNYLDENIYNYAVMIDGEWGCGKTYLVKDYLCDKLKDHEKKKAKNINGYMSKGIIYISLYGVKSLEDVSKQILMESYLAKTGNATRIFKKGSEIAGTVLPIMLPLIGLEQSDFHKVQALLEKLLPIKDSVIIFDDLERCSCPINEILGYINTFVEHNKTKIIIVANQKEIQKNAYWENQELKYLVVANRNIDFDDRTIKINGNKDAENTMVTVNTIKDRVNKLFGQDVPYEKVKEKLIGITICYHPDLHTIFSNLIEDKYKNETQLKSLLLEKITFYEEFMNLEKHTNLRTFQFYLSKISTLYKEICKLDGIGKMEFLKYIIEYSFKVCVCYKNGTLEQKDWDGRQYCLRSMGKIGLDDHVLAFRFVDEFITKSSLDQETIKKMLKVYADDYRKDPAEALAILNDLEKGWYRSDDTTVEMKVDAIISTLAQDKFTFKEYPRIIKLFVQLEKAGFSNETVEKMIFEMKNNIKNLKNHVSFDEGFEKLLEGEKRTRYKEIIADIQENIEHHFHMQIPENLKTFLEKEDHWAEKLYEYVYKNQKQIRKADGFLAHYDNLQLAKKIGASMSYDIDDFRKCIRLLYSNDPMGTALNKEIEKLTALKKTIEELDKSSFDKIKRMQINLLISDLKNLL